jgi:opacity protein-like surface antigen
MSAKLSAIEFSVSPSMLYDQISEKLQTNEIDRSGFMPGIGVSMSSPVIRHNWKNNANLRFNYGILRYYNDTTEYTSNGKVWQINAEDTVSFYSKVNSRIAPYIGAGYTFDKFRIDEAKNDTTKNKTGDFNRFYVPVGFVVKATDNFTLDFRYERDAIKKYNKSSSILVQNANLIAQKATVFEQGNGFAVGVDWHFLPANNTGLGIRFKNHKVLFKRDTNDNPRTENSILIQLHWLSDF